MSNIIFGRFEFKFSASARVVVCVQRKIVALQKLGWTKIVDAEWGVIDHNEEAKGKGVGRCRRGCVHTLATWNYALELIEPFILWHEKLEFILTWLTWLDLTYWLQRIQKKGTSRRSFDTQENNRNKVISEVHTRPRRTVFQRWNRFRALHFRLGQAVCKVPVTVTHRLAATATEICCYPFIVWNEDQWERIKAFWC